MANYTWSEQQLLVAMNLYTKLPFGKFDAKTPQVIHLAKAIGRTPGALAMKLCNFASLDPLHQKRGVRGLKNASKGDREIWERFEQNWTSMALLSEAAIKQLDMPLSLGESDTVDYKGNTTTSEVQSRLGQSFFRQAVLAAYQRTCCITGNPIPELLTASHILPWAESEENRLNPSNGLCLAKTQDAAFDRGLITLDEKLRIVVSSQIRDFYTQETIKDNFERYDGCAIKLPHRFPPRTDFMDYHRNHVFVA